MKKLLTFVLCICSVLWVQAMDISGTVTDMNGDPVIGAAVAVVGTTHGTVTDMDGKFQLSVNAGDKISVSYLGYKTQTIVVKDAQPLAVSMSEDTEVLEDGMVTELSLQL